MTDIFLNVELTLGRYYIDKQQAAALKRGGFMNLLIYRNSPKCASSLIFDEVKNLPCDANDQEAVRKLAAMLSAILDDVHVEHCLILDNAGVVHCTPGFDKASKNALRDLCETNPKLRNEIETFALRRIAELFRSEG